MPHGKGTLVDIYPLFHQVLVEAIERGVQKANASLDCEAEVEEEPCSRSWRGYDEDRRRR